MAVFRPRWWPIDLLRRRVLLPDVAAPTLGVKFHDGTSVVTAASVKFHDGTSVVSASSISLG